MTDETQGPHVLAPGRAPTPFTADEIRAGCPTGRTIRLRVDVVGETAFHRVSRFVECDQAGATMEHSRLSLDGSPLAEPEVDRVTWRDLQTHASFAADDTTIESEWIETAIGELDCLRYTVRPTAPATTSSGSPRTCPAYPSSASPGRTARSSRPFCGGNTAP